MGERIRRKSVLLNKKRRKIYEHVKVHPGSSFREILRSVEVGPNEGSWHLRILEKVGLVENIRFGRYLVYYPKGWNRDNCQKEKWSRDARFVLRQDKAFRIAKYLMGNREAKISELAESIGLHRNTVKYYVNRLEQTGLINKCNHDKIMTVSLRDEAKGLVKEIEVEPRL